MHTNEQPTNRDRRALRLVRRVLLSIGGAIAAAVVMSSPAWADAWHDEILPSEAVTESVAGFGRLDDVVGSPLVETGVGLDVVPVVPASPADVLKVIEELGPREVVPTEPRQVDLRPAETMSSVPLPPVETGGAEVTAVLVHAPGVPSDAPSEELASSNTDERSPLSGVIGGCGQDETPAPPRSGDNTFSGYHVAAAAAEVSQPLRYVRTSSVRVVSVLVGKQPGRTPD